MKIIITGGVGYIGSHVVLAALDHGHEVTVFDDLSTANKKNINLKTKFIKGSINSKKDLLKLFANDKYDAVIHLAASKASGESMLNPKKYAQNNIIGSLNILISCIDHGVKYFIFSSSAAVYGEPEHLPVTELHPFNPVNPYGDTKAEVEKILKSYEESCGLKYVSLRYFNACGAHLDGTIGEMHDPETHLIPLVLQVASGRKKHISVFGDDYPTPDGTCVRDYVHVMDIVEAHILAMENLTITNKSQVFNIGNKKGFSVNQIIQMAKEITKVDIPFKIQGRRKGDPAELIADNKKIMNLLNWNPKYSELETIVKSAWNWEKTLKIK